MLKLQEAKTLKLGIYPYTYVRTAVMKSLLFKKDDYDKMLKMGFSEIANLMQESSYRKEVNELAREYSGADLLEMALNRNLAYSFKKLIMISPYELSLLIKEYAKRKDIEDIKTIIRGIFTNTEEKQILNSITAAGTLSYDFLVSLLKSKSIEHVLKNNKLVDFNLLLNGLNGLKEENNLVGIENAFDKFYYNHLMQFSKILPREGVLFRDFLINEVEISNILTLLRLKKAKFGKEIVKGFLISSGNRLKDAKISRLSELDDFDDISKAFEKTEYRGIIAHGIDEFKKDGSLIRLETELYKHLLKKSVLLLHQHPLSVDVILGYMLAKDIEVRNLRIIIKGKQLGLGEDFIESQLVF